MSTAAVRLFTQQFIQGTDQRKKQSSTPLARSPVNSPHKGPVTRKMFSFDDVIMISGICALMLSQPFQIKTFVPVNFL